MAYFSDRVFIEGGVQHQTDSGRLLVFITVTEDSHARSFADSGKALTKFVRDLGRAAVGRSNEHSVPWLSVGELHRGSTIHWHLLMAGLAYPWDRRNGAPLRRKGLSTGDVVSVLGLSGHCVSKDATLLPLLARHGFGTGFAGMRQVGFDHQSHSGVGNYLAKYLSKGDAGRELPKGFQLVRASRGRNAWWPDHTLVSVRRAQRDELSRAKLAERVAQ